MEFHISRRVREKYGLDETLFAFNGSAIFLNLQAVKRFADKLNRQRDLIHFPENAVKVGQANALGLIDEIFHYVIHLYRQEKQLDIFDEINQTLETLIGSDRYTAFLVQFISEFPPQVVYDKHLTPEAYLAQTTDGKSNREDVLEELLLFWLENQNPALKPFKEIFEAPELTKNPNFEVAIHTIRQTFAESQKFGPDNQSLVDMLLSPSIAVPNSLSGQLEFIREKWASLLGSFLYRLLLGLDVLKEESRQGFGGPGPVEVPVYYKGNVFGTEEAEQFSADREWMPRLVLIAKNAFVWLDQLSKKYGYPIHHLDQIPEEELRTLADRGFTGLWLIGLWERSRASAKIKQLLGNPDAIASAYSLHSYEIASDLGGEEAYRVLRDRAWAFGIRLASDMVPNHMAIDSDWVNHHPERFISLDQSPYPAYTFNGPDLSSDPGIVVQIEDHYYDRTDAAVVFRRIDKASGETRFIYHGNDGTSMPWNDTAQLNYLDPQVREAVIQTILEVARKFPIIRFDAAMTLAKKHYQRLWFPQPGTGGDIPSRAEHGMSQQQFDQAMPVEFWREVVDRVAREAPDTLLLAEAFWMMEGYFVRTLGMHRVYNSALMNMLRNEDNTHYRQLLKNTLEFEPEILKRYVNFMNNPDERTAVDQFGKGDKYFGICVLMSTFPGLPMFGHGQVEGFTEKYGMEFRRAYIDEYPDGDLIRRHNLQIAPLLHRRELFAGVEHFWLFDFYLPGGAVDENVYAYTNAHGVDRTLVIYNNRLNQTDGWIHLSASQLMREGSQKKMNRTTLADQLIQDDHSGDYLIFRDQMSGLQFLRPCSQIKSSGLHFHLNGYESHVFLDFRQVTSDEWHAYDRLHALIGENGIPDIDAALGSLLIQPILNTAADLLAASHLNQLLAAEYDPSTGEIQLPEATPELVANLLKAINQTTGLAGDIELNTQQILQSIRAALRMRDLESMFPVMGYSIVTSFAAQISTLLKTSPFAMPVLIIFSMLHNLGCMKDPTQCEEISAIWFEEWQLGRLTKESLQSMGATAEQAEHSVEEIRAAIGLQNWYSEAGNLEFPAILQQWMSTPEIQQFLKVNRFEGQVWFDGDAMTRFEKMLSMLPIFDALRKPETESSRLVETMAGTHEILTRLHEVSMKSEYKLDRLLEAAAEDLQEKP